MQLISQYLLSYFYLGIWPIFDGVKARPHGHRGQVGYMKPIPNPIAVW